MFIGSFGDICAYEQREILLEGFEDNIDNVIPATDDGSRGANGNLKLTHFQITDAEEIWVTQGKRALQIEFLNDQKWWAVDFLIYLDQDATAELQAAWNVDPELGFKPEARYVLKYDVTFPETGVSTSVVFVSLLAIGGSFPIIGSSTTSIVTTAVSQATGLPPSHTR